MFTQQDILVTPKPARFNPSPAALPAAVVLRRPFVWSTNQYCPPGTLTDYRYVNLNSRGISEKRETQP
jgi:hypothetical protein